MTLIKPKFTVYGNSDFDDKISSDMELINKRVLEKIPSKHIAAIILGGGYGRGEGGVSIDESGKMDLYNDYDMFMITNSLDRATRTKYQEILFKIGEELKEVIGIDVDFGPLKNRSELSSMPFTLMYYELKNGHHVIYGEKEILSLLPDYDIKNIPHEETLNYMLNRGVGLYLAGERLKAKNKDLEDLKFIERNIYKAFMACGDIFLILRNNYSHSYIERVKFIDKYSERDIITDDNFKILYKASIKYKLKPQSSFENLEKLHSECINVFEKFYIYAFNAYWCTTLEDMEQYYSHLKSDGIKNCFSIGNLPKNAVLNLTKLGLKNFSIKFFSRYPRYRLFYVIPLLLFGYNNRHSLCCRAMSISKKSSTESLAEKFITVWNRFN